MTAGPKPWCAVVMPCLNEQDSLAAACRSLGFDGTHELPARCVLVLVDNGSTDRTADICRALQSELGAAVVNITQEPRRGHVQTRRHGNQTAARIARTREISYESLIVIQADADAIYSPGYVDTVRKAIWAGTGKGRIGQAITEREPGLERRYPRVFAEVDAVDQTIRQRFGTPPLDPLVDDKACAYTLRDYKQWGGHRREYLDNGSELLAETTRLTIAALAQGADLVEIVDASVVHSQRRLLADAAQQLASAGFPYADRRLFPARTDVKLDDLERMVAHNDRELLNAVLTTRAAHLAALTVVLPAHLLRTLTGEMPQDSDVRAALMDVPHRTVQEAAATPGRLVGDVLALAAKPSTLLASLNIS
jgi:hypothetical protein